MDVNQTRFHLVYGQNDWLPAAPLGSPSLEPLFDWNRCDATLSLHQQLFIFPASGGELPLDLSNRRGAGRDRYGNWYWISEERQELRFLGMNKTNSEHFWSQSDAASNCVLKGDFLAAPSTPPEAMTFSGLAVMPEHYLVVGTLQPKGLLIFDLYSGGPPSHLLWPGAVDFQPFDMAVTEAGGVLILDRSNLRYWQLDRNFRVQSDWPIPTAPATQSAFQPLTPAVSPQSCAVNEVNIDFSVSLGTVSDPIAIESLPDGSVLVLDNPPGAYYSLVHCFQKGAESDPPSNLWHALVAYVPDSPSPGNPYPQALRAYDFAFSGQTTIPDAAGTLYIVQDDGNQSFAFDVYTAAGFAMDVEPRYFPMRKFAGKGLVVANGSAYYDFQDTWIPLAEQPRPQYQRQAQLTLPPQQDNASPATPPAAFDGKQPGCVWHRLFLDAWIPPGASVTVESRAADQQNLLASTPWQTEPQPYLRANGAEIPYYTPQLKGPADRVGTWELLFQNARGRYLQLRLTLAGTGRNTPRIQALRIYYPRFSYLRHYLPAVYQDDPVSASFLDRYLANIEGYYTALEDKIAGVQELFDVRVLPAEYLDWLASWMSITLDPTWSESTRRLVLSHAPQMFRERGTPNGIIRAIRLMLNACPDDSLFAQSNCDSAACAQSESIFSVRLVENLLTQHSPVSTSASSQTPGSISSSQAPQWTPAQGPEPLNARYRCYLQNQYGSIESLNAAWSANYSGFDDAALVLPPVQPASGTPAQDWSKFLRDGIGFTYAPVTSSDSGVYQTFLSEQYTSIQSLNIAYGLTGSSAFSSFSSIPLPATMPASGSQLQDWILFVSQALPQQQNAHKFTVLVPVLLTDSPQTQQTKLLVAQRIAEIEKPAHSSFEVRLYWGMFRAGEARLGLDTLLGPGSRFAALVLGSGYLASGNLAPAAPAVRAGRGPIGEPALLQPCCEVNSQVRCV